MRAVKCNDELEMEVPTSDWSQGNLTVLGGKLGVRVVLAFLSVLMAVALHAPIVAAQSSDATLSSLTIHDGTAEVGLTPSFSSVTTSYVVALKYRGELITVDAVQSDANATLVFQDRSGVALDDFDANTPGHQIETSVGATGFRITVTAADLMTERTYEISVQRDGARLFSWSPTRDLNTLAGAGNASPQGIWSDGTTIWIADDDDDKLYAYTLASGVRDNDAEFNLHADNVSPRGLWSNGTTIWIADPDDDKLYAYTLKDDPDTTGTDEQGQRRQTGGLPLPETTEIFECDTVHDSVSILRLNTDNSIVASGRCSLHP